MAYNFVKLWTDALTDSWFISLSLAEKGLFTMLLLLCKNGADDGTVRGQNVAHLAALCTGNRKTVDRMLSKMAKVEKIVWTKNPQFVQVTILNYGYWQGLKGGDYGKSARAKRKSCGQNNHELTNLDVDETRRDSDNDSDETRRDTTVGRSADADYSKKLRKSQREEQFPTQLIYFKSFPFSENLTERKQYELAAWLNKRCLSPTVATELLHARNTAFLKIKTETGFRKYVNTVIKDADSMGEIESAAHKYDDHTKRGGDPKSMKDVMEIKQDENSDRS